MNKASKYLPWAIIPTLYFAEGLPFTIINHTSVAMLKSMDFSNEIIALTTSLLYWPWALKMFWSPFIDGYRTKRKWILTMQFLLAISFALLAFVAQLSNPLYPIISVMMIAAFFSATHDISIDGYYMHILDQKKQAFFSGIRSTFYRFALIFGSGTLVTLAGTLEDVWGINLAWSFSISISAALLLLSSIYHKFILPSAETDKPVKQKNEIPLIEIFKMYFKHKNIIPIFTFILLYRFGEGIVVKMAQPFVMDPIDKGGMGVSLEMTGVYYGTIGVISLVIGGILGGILIKKYSLKKLIWPMALSMNLPNVLYIYLSLVRPDSSLALDLTFLHSDWLFTINPILQGSIIIEQFGYGFGFTAFLVYLLYASKGKYQTSFYAISTGIMAFGMMIPGAVSGYMSTWLGYSGMFTAATLLTIPGMLIIFFLPMNYEENNLEAK